MSGFSLAPCHRTPAGPANPRPPRSGDRPYPRRARSAEDVPTGFPKTPEGAIAQLAAIEATVLQGMSIDRAHAIHAAWSVPGAGPAHSWALVGSIQPSSAATPASTHRNRPPR